MSHDPLHGLLDALLDALADRIAERLERRDATRISQRDRRGLGPRRHREAVKRRIRENQGGAFIIGRDFLLTPEALREELERFGPRGVDPDAVRPAAATPRKGKSARSAEKAEVAAFKQQLEADLAALRRGKQ